MRKIHYCTRCVIPNSAATPMVFNEEGICSACVVSMQKDRIDWNLRRKMLFDLVDEYRSKSNYDIVVPVSGGKASYFQVHVARNVLGLKPLLVTYHGNNYLPEGEYNLNRMREIFDCDHIVFRPSMDILIKMNRIGFRLHGDMNWHAHCGIYTVLLQVAVRYKVPLILWGEQGFMDVGGLYSHNDFVEFTAKFRKEHTLCGYDWSNFTDDGLESLGRGGLKEGLTAKDLIWAVYPSDEEIAQAGTRAIYLPYFMPWDANAHVQLVKDLYGWRDANKSFLRTYHRISNLNDMHENGIHDYLKFVKFGYGRGTDHSCKDIRAGIMTREQGIKIVRLFDHVKPDEDLARWLTYVGMSEEEFDITCDGFRGKRVWWVEKGQWFKDTLWGGPQPFGPVRAGADL